MSSDAFTPVTAPLARTPGGFQWLARALDWITHHERCVLTFGVVFQVIFLGVMMVRPLTTLRTGDAVLLRVVPIDPRDLFRGDYVTLSYDINRPGLVNATTGERDWRQADRLRDKQGSTVYVTLEPEPDGRHWRSGAYQFERPSAGKFIRGTVTGNGMVEFGIEKFFVEEGQGHAYEQAVLDKKLSAEVVIDKNGAAQIKRLIIE